MTEKIYMSVPAKVEFISVIRLCTSGALSSFAVNIEELEDIKLAISEACIEVLACGGNSLEYVLEVDDQHMKAEIKGRDAKVLCDLSDEHERKLGRLIMLSLMDDVTFHEQQVIMTKEFS